MKRLLIVLLGIVSFSGTVIASDPKVFAEKGNIFYSSSDTQKLQRTNNGKDRAPVLSPDGTKIVFIRKSDNEAYLAVGGPEDYLQSGPDALLADQVWVIDSDGRNEKVLVKDRYPNEARGNEITKELEKTIAHIDDESLCFSPDGETVYFISSAWVTSGALHSVKIDGSDERFITGANSIEVVPRGQYKGNLVIRKHRYFLAGGSYDWLWLITPEGEEVGPLGDDLDDDQREFLYSEKL